MMPALIQTLLAVALLSALQWKMLKQSDKVTRWLSLGLIALSGGIYFYTMSAVHVPHPSVWLDAVLRPYSPI